MKDTRPGPKRWKRGPRAPWGALSMRTIVPAVAVSALFLVGFGLRSMLRSRTVPAEESVRTVYVPAPPPPESVYDTLRTGETLAEVLDGHGFSAQEIHRLIEVVREYKSPRSFRPGVVVRLTGPPGQPAEQVLLQLNQDSILALDAQTDGWASDLVTVPIRVDTLLLAGLIQSSLWNAELRGQVERLGDGEFQEYVYDLADVFAWKVDFTRDIRRGDAFRVAIERELRPDGTVRTRRFIAIELRNRGRVMSAIPFARPDGQRHYFDVDGEALRGVFLRYPVPYRITSGFSNRRFHPVLKQYRAHRGTDYGAPYGTSVKATAAGTVTRAGTWGGYGRMVEIRHTQGIQTRYAHLSSIASGIRAGARVNQGQVIGRVGATGLATGPHLHYEFLQNGAYRNISNMNLPSAPALEEAYMPEFLVGRDAALDLLSGVALPATLTDLIGPSVAD